MWQIFHLHFEIRTRLVNYLNFTEVHLVISGVLVTSWFKCATSVCGLRLVVQMIFHTTNDWAVLSRIRSDGAAYFEIYIKIDLHADVFYHCLQLKGEIFNLRARKWKHNETWLRFFTIGCVGSEIVAIYLAIMSSTTSFHILRVLFLMMSFSLTISSFAKAY